MLSKPFAAPSIPAKCYEHFHMTMTEYALYDINRAWSDRTGLLFFDGMKLSEQFQHASKSNTYKLANSLVRKGWFAPQSEPKRRGNALRMYEG
jgi:hypothetical protein